jgi:hypothetical protein
MKARSFQMTSHAVLSRMGRNGISESWRTPTRTQNAIDRLALLLGLLRLSRRCEPQAAAALGEQWRSMQSLGRSSLGASYERPRNLHHLEGRNQDSQQTAVVGIWRRLSATIRSHSAASLIRTAFAFEEEAIALAILRYSSARSISSSIVSAGGCSIAM